MALAYDTLIKVSADSEKAIQHFFFNDPVWACDKQSPNSWLEKTVLFIKDSSGVNHLIKIEFQNGARRGVLVVSHDQAFLTPAKTFKQAEHLIASKDLLVMGNGNTCAILSSNSMYSDIQTRDIATTKKPGENNRELIIANGIVVGDYMTRWIK